MSHYHRGLAHSVPAFQKQAVNGIYRVGLIPGYVSTGEVLREMGVLNDEIHASDKEILTRVDESSERDEQKRLHDFWLGAWSEFLNRWDSFYQRNKSWTARFLDTNDVYNKTQEFRREYIQFRALAEEAGMSWDSPVPRAPFADANGLLSAAGDAAKKAAQEAKDIWLYSLIGVAVVGGLVILFLAMRGGSTPIVIPGKGTP